MKGDPFKHVHSGDPVQLHHVSFNAMLDAGRDFRAREGLGSGQPKGFSWSPCHIRIRNTSGADRDRFHVLGLGAPTITPADNLASFQESPALDGVTPGDTHWGNFGILLKPLPQNAVGPALVAGVLAMQVEIGHAAHPFADITIGSAAKLTSGWVGAAEIINNAESGTGLKWCLVRLGTPSVVTYIGKADAAIAKNATSGTVSVWESSGSSWADTGADIANCRNLTANIAAGKWVSVVHVRARIGQPWIPLVAPLEC